MTAQPVEEDGALIPALQLLEDAIHRLCGPQSKFIEGRLLYAPSRYMTLMDATSGEQVNTGNGGGSKSRPPCWLDAVDLINEIDESVACWQPAFTGVPPTVGRLQWIEKRKWRPQDTRQVEQITRALAEWAHEIDALLDPPRRWTLPSPCPACGTDIVYRRDNGGDMVRQPALQLGDDGCRCMKCKAHWPPSQYVFLAKVLGSLPGNVIHE